MRTADNRVNTVLELYGSSLSDRYAAGEVRAIARAVFHDRLGWDTAQLELRRQASLSESELLKVYEPLERLATGEPLQYVLGSVQFHGLHLKVGPGVLIPRPETEELVERIIASGAVPTSIVDIGTGSGCIALALKRAFPTAHVLACDISEDALNIARINARHNDLEVEMRVADVLDPDFMLPPGCDLVVSNPPYVPRSEGASLSEQVRGHEPHLALFVDDDDPMNFHRRIAELAFVGLPGGGGLWFEAHYLHAKSVGLMVERMGYASVQVIKDLSGNDRFIHAER